MAGTVTLSGTTATFHPSASLANATTYTATITTGVTDLANNALAASKVWTFTTGAAADTTPPTVSFHDPGRQPERRAGKHRRARPRSARRWQAHP